MNRLLTVKAICLVFTFALFSNFEQLKAQCTSTPVREAVRNGDFEAGYLTGTGTVHNFTPNGPFDFRSDVNFIGNYNPAGPCSFSMGNQYGVARLETRPACGGPNAQFGNGYVNSGDFRDRTPGQNGNGFALLVDFEGFSGTGVSGSGRPAAWRQEVDIFPNQRYVFSAWFANYNRNANLATYEVPELRFVVVPINAANNLVFAERVEIGTASPTGVMNWQQFSGTWIPLNNYNRVALFIEVVQANAINTNDIALDDISFINSCQNLASLPANLIPNLGNDQSICLTNGTVNLNSSVSTGGTTQFWWFRDNGTPTETELVVASNTQNTLAVTQPGTYRVCVQNASDPNSCSASSTVTITSTMPPVNLANQNLCSTPSVTLDAGVSGPLLTYEWFKRPVGVNDPGNVRSFNSSTPGVYAVRVSSSAAASCLPVTSNDITLTSLLASPSVVTAASAMICGENPSVTVAATGNSTSFAWYDAATGGNLLGVGTPLNRQFGTLSRTIYVEGVNLLTAMPQTSYPLNDNNGGDLARSNPSFNALESFTLVSVDVAPSAFCGTPGTIRLQQNGVDVPGTTVALPACNTTNYQTVVLNYNIPVGNNYSLVYSGGTARYQFRNSFSATTFGDVVRVNGNAFGTGSFFNWQIRTGSPCIRTPLELSCVAPVRFFNERILKTANQNTLVFEIAEPEGFEHFIIEHSANGINFEPLGKLAFEQAKNTYSFILPIHSNPYLRVRTEEADPSFSRMLFANVEKSLGFNVFPNPFSDHFTISSNEMSNEKVTVDVYNMFGQKIELNLSVFESQPIGMSWPKGVYFVLLKTESAQELWKVVKK